MPTTIVWAGTPATWTQWPGTTDLALSRKWAAYDTIYRQQLWVYVVNRKLAWALARLPLPVYQRDDLNREEARDHPYAQLLRRPSEKHSQFFFWWWTSATFDVFGEVFWVKERDRGGRPVALVPFHPTGMRQVDDRMWEFRNGALEVTNIRVEDVVHIKSYNPSDLGRGLSPLEPLRSTLENEDAARRATSAFWKNGGRPSIVITHPTRLSETAAGRVKADWDRIHSGVDNFAKAAVLEEGMKPEVISLSAEDAQYIESRKLNREEVCAAYDVPPPVVHILDRATFSNITEQMRSMYRDTMAPRLAFFESELERQLRAGVNPRSGNPDFGGDVYAEFKLDEVLRGDFEQRADAYQKGINAGWLQPAEVRKFENLPAVTGSDQLLINSALVPIAAAGESAGSLPLDGQMEGRGLSEVELRTLMGRLGRIKTLEELHPGTLVSGLNGTHYKVLAEYEAARAQGDTVDQFKVRLKTLAIQ